MNEQIKKINILIVIVLFSVSYIFSQNAERYIIKHLDKCNDELSNFGTTFYGEKQVIYSSPRKDTRFIKNIWQPNEQPFLELYLADINDDGELVNPKPIGRKVNSKFHESNVTFTNDYSTVYFSRDKYFKNKLDKDKSGITHISMFKADVKSPNEWINITPMPFNNRDYSVGHPTLNQDNTKLYFSSNMRGNDDIYYVDIHSDGTYGKPVSVKQINTLSSERFPFYSDDGFLYFSSDKEGGYGKLDIYAVKLDGKSKPVNLGDPINSYSDDFCFSKKKGADFGYFSSSRSNEGKGDDDIYYFKQTGELPCNQFAEGIVVDKETGNRIPRALVEIYDESGKKLNYQIVDEDAKFSFEIDCTSKYKVIASKENYSEDSKEFVFDTNLELSLGLVFNNERAQFTTSSRKPIPHISPSQFNKCQAALDMVNNIYFDLNKSYIRPDAASELDKVIKIMKRCSNIYVEASSHTDCRASKAYNKALSQRRAQATVDYIVNYGGIDSFRINAVGYGETKLRNRCSDGVKCTESEHEMNRRTQFKITNF